MFSYTSNAKVAFCGGCANLYSNQLWLRTSFAPHFHQHFLFSIWLFTFCWSDLSLILFPSLLVWLKIFSDIWLFNFHFLKVSTQVFFINFFLLDYLSFFFLIHRHSLYILNSKFFSSSSFTLVFPLPSVFGISMNRSS